MKKMRRTREQWAGMKPAFALAASTAHIRYALEDAKADITALLALLDECRATLAECAECLDRHTDVVDGPEGAQLPNEATRLHTEVEALLAKMEVGR